MPSLRAVSALVLMAFLLSGSFLTLRQDFAQRKAADAAALTTLASIWQDYQMPMPPEGAALERLEVRHRSEWPLFTSIGFRLPQGPPGTPDTFLCGAQTVESTGKPVRPGGPPVSLAGLEDLSGPDGLLGISSLYGLAVQCQDRGWTPLAVQLFRQAAGPLPVRPDLGYQLVWQHLLAECLQPGRDRTAIARQMQRLLQAGHDLPQGKGPQIHAALTTDTSPPTPSPESLIAGILAERLDHSTIQYDAIGRGARMSDPFYDLEDLGFAAVPVLIAHLDDERRTGRMSAAMFDHMIPHPIRVKDLARTLLHQILGYRLREYARSLPRPGPDYNTLVRAVWAQAQAMGEEAWLVDGAPTGEHGYFHLRRLLQRNPERLPDVLRFQLKHRPQFVPHPILTAIEISPLPIRDKLALLKEAAAIRENPVIRGSALEAISRLDPDFFRQQAIRDLDHMPADSSGSSPFCLELQLARLAYISTDPEVWAAFQRATQRAELRLRVQLIDNITGFSPHPENQLLRLQYLAALFEDFSVRDLEEPQFIGVDDIHHIPRLRICDLAALQAARVLGWPDRPDKNWTEAQWIQLRLRVRKTLQLKTTWSGGL